MCGVHLNSWSFSLLVVFVLSVSFIFRKDLADSKYILNLIYLFHVPNLLFYMFLFGRTLLMREVLILLNRLVSHPKYSSHVLRALTNSREKTTLTVDVTSRVSGKRKFLWQDVSMTRQIRESEIIDLAQVLRRRVFTFLGGSS